MANNRPTRPPRIVANHRRLLGERVVGIYLEVTTEEWWKQDLADQLRGLADEIEKGRAEIEEKT